LIEEKKIAYRRMNQDFYRFQNIIPQNFNRKVFANSFRLKLLTFPSAHFDQRPLHAQYTNTLLFYTYIKSAYVWEQRENRGGKTPGLRHSRK